MTLTLTLTPEQEKKLSEEAARNGVDQQTYILRCLFGDVTTSSSDESLADRLRELGVLGAIEGKPRSDGRNRSEIEVATAGYF